ncbi:MAG: PQQ-binding-like beta-propeller repeat protein [Acidimicrobiales bacterium]|nr:PQQ-binding-like beta-propeller repeat protein [Acidimicrobiales bacterium]
MADSSVCSACGAMLPLPDLAGLQTCPSCGRVTRSEGGPGWPAPPVQAPDPASQWSAPAPIPGAPAAPPTPPPTPSKRPGASPSPGRLIGCAVVPIIVIVAVAGILVAVLRSASSSNGGSSGPGSVAFDRSSSLITLSGSVQVVASSAERTEVIAVTQDTDTGSAVRRLARIRFTAEGSEELWHTDPIDDSAYRAQVAVVGDTLFAGIGDDLLALDAGTGEQRWTATLSDKVTLGCERCFSAVGDHLVVRTTDAYVASYAERSAEPLWTRRLVSPQGSISVVGGRLFVVDEPESDDQLTAVQTVDPATGKTVRTVTPSCEPTARLPWSLQLSPGDPVREIPGAGDVLAVFGFGESCAVRWNPGTGAIRWATTFAESGSISQDGVVVGAHDVVAPSTSSTIAVLDLETHESRNLEAPADTTVVPAQIVGRTLVAGSATNRGTPKRGLVGWDLTSGERTWAVRLSGDPELIAPDPYFSSDALFEGSPRVLLVPDGDDLRAFTFDGEQRTFAVATVDLATGDLRGGARRGFLSRYDAGTPSLTVEAVLPDRVLVSIDNALQALPPDGNGTVVGFPDGH